MALAGYCLIDGLDGECEDKGHDKWIKITDFSHSVAQRHNMGSTAGDLAGQGPDFGLFSITHQIDLTSVDLNRYCATGEHVPQVDVEFCTSAGGEQPYMRYTIKRALIVNVSPIADENNVKPLEIVDFAYDEITWKYTKYKSDGSMDSELEGGYNLATNEAT